MFLHRLLDFQGGRDVAQFDTVHLQAPFVGSFIEDDSTLTPTQSAYQNLLREKVEEVLSTLTPREARILRLFEDYGIRIEWPPDGQGIP